MQWLCYGGFLICLFAIVPLPGEDKIRYVAPTQVVFRFDEFRYLQLTGYRCQGRLDYIDEQKQIYSLLAPHSARIITEPFAHMPEDYIFIPFSDYSGIQFSRDGGRSFLNSVIDTSDNSGYYRPSYKSIDKIVVVNNQMFLKDKNKGIYRSPKPFGTGTGYDLLSPVNASILEGHMRYMGARWDDPPQAMPTMPANYHGWNKWQCDLNLKQEMVIYNRYTPFHQWQKKLRDLLRLSPNGGKA